MSERSSLSDHDLLAAGVHDLVLENAAHARRLDRLLEFHRRCEERSDDSRFPLTPVQETVVEVGELWGLSPGRVRSELQRARVLATYLPDVWSLCLAGGLDGYRAGLVADAATSGLPETSWPAFAERIGPWLRHRLRRPGDDPSLPLVVAATVKQLRNKLTYETNRLRPRDADERFRTAYAERRAVARTHPVDGSPGDGTGSLTLTDSVDRILLADHRLTLAAKSARASGDPRTLEQLRTDLAVDLILGETVPGSGFARPVINVTVPIQTLMGVSDDPGYLSGGTSAGTLARMVAQQPGSTWHRCSARRAASRCRRSLSRLLSSRPGRARPRHRPPTRTLRSSTPSRTSPRSSTRTAPVRARSSTRSGRTPPEPQGLTDVGGPG